MGRRSRPRRRSHRQRRTAVAGEGSPHAVARDDACCRRIAGGVSRSWATDRNAPRSKPSRGTTALPSASSSPARSPIRLPCDARARRGLLVDLRGSLQRDHRGAGLRHAGGVDELPLRAARNPPGRPLWRADAGRRCDRHGCGDRSRTDRRARPRGADGARAQLHRRRAPPSDSSKSSPSLNRRRAAASGPLAVASAS